MFPWKQEVHHSEMHVLNLTNIYEVFNSHNRQTVTMNKRKCNYHFSTNIYKTYYQRPLWGFDFGHFRGARGGKNLDFILKKKSKPFYKLKLIVPNLF